MICNAKCEWPLDDPLFCYNVVPRHSVHEGKMVRFVVKLKGFPSTMKQIGMNSLKKVFIDHYQNNTFVELRPQFTKLWANFRLVATCKPKWWSKRRSSSNSFATHLFRFSTCHWTKSLPFYCHCRKHHRKKI